MIPHERVKLLGSDPHILSGTTLRTEHFKSEPPIIAQEFIKRRLYVSTCVEEIFSFDGHDS